MNNPETLLGICFGSDKKVNGNRDMRSHTGGKVRIFSGPADVESSKQKINTKSTAESELVGLSDFSGACILQRQYLVAQGYNLDAVKIYQENKSTISLINAGHSTSKRTRHINVKYFYLKDRIDNNEIKIEHVASTEMLADILTKPLHGELFRKFRSMLRNVKM